MNWSLRTANGESGANAIENGVLILGGRSYGLCPGFPNPAELELIDAGTTGIVVGVIGYPGKATVNVSESTAGTFDVGQALPPPDVQVVQGVSFFIRRSAQVGVRLSLARAECDLSRSVRPAQPRIRPLHGQIRSCLSPRVRVCGSYPPASSRAARAGAAPSSHLQVNRRPLSPPPGSNPAILRPRNQMSRRRSKPSTGMGLRPTDASCRGCRPDGGRGRRSGGAGASANIRCFGACGSPGGLHGSERRRSPL